MNQSPASKELFVYATQKYVASLLRRREGEVKLGERIGVVESVEQLTYSKARFVLIGIPEDIGVRANQGMGGAHTVWEPALQAFLNTQEGESCSGTDVLLLGAFNFDHWMAASESMDAERMRALVDNIDEAVYPVIEAVVRAGKIPIVIGGGHNNAYPLLQGTSYALGGTINCINLDAHSDYRRIEGRHTGNPFRFARQDGFMDKYAVVGLHRAYNSQAVLDEMQADKSIHCSFYEDIFLEAPTRFREAVAEAVSHTAGNSTGIELDLDCIAGVLSSAATPCGITALQARQYLRQVLSQSQAAYVHIAEGAIRLRDGREDASTAKLVAYLIRDVISSLPKGA
jgi:formiminoglutamase